MKQHHIVNNIYKTIFIVYSFTSFAYASESNSPPMLYMSNNTGQISIEKAYSKILTSDQLKLEESVINILQKYKVQQGKFNTLLGVYQNYGDNVEEFTFSPYDTISESNINDIAQKIAVSLNQHSVLVFRPGECTSQEVTVEFAETKEPQFKQVDKIINNKLDKKYAHSFSMHLDNSYSGIQKAHVTKVVWFGNHAKPEELQKVFPDSKVNSRCGDVYLIYQDGKREAL